MNWSDGYPLPSCVTGTRAYFLTSLGRRGHRGGQHLVEGEGDGSSPFVPGFDVPDGRDRIRQRQDWDKPKGEQADRGKGKKNNTA